MELIEKQAVIESLNRIPRINGIGMELLIAVPDVEEMIAGLPAVDAAPVKHGQWVKEEDRVNHWHCSECGSVWGLAHKVMKYCPNCEAKMDLEGLYEAD